MMWWYRILREEIEYRLARQYAHQIASVSLRQSCQPRYRLMHRNMLSTVRTVAQDEMTQFLFGGFPSAHTYTPAAGSLPAKSNGERDISNVCKNEQRTDLGIAWYAEHDALNSRLAQYQAAYDDQY